MRFYYLLFLVVTFVNADYTSLLIEKSTEVYNDAKEKTIKLVTPKELTKEEKREIHLNEVWGNVFDELSDGADCIIELDSVPDSAWIGTDKEDVQKDIDTILESMIETLIGDDLFLYKNKIAELNEEITDNKIDIVEYREKKIGAPLTSMVVTTKSQYDEKISELKEENKGYEDKIEIVKNDLKERFSNIGVDLSSDQIDVLLSRVDGNDIIQMSLVMDVLKHITAQIMDLMKESKEELEQAKKYYGMHLICLELVVYIQQKYIDKVDHKYIPRVDMLLTTAENMLLETEKLRRKEEDNSRRSVYSKNIEAQKLSYKTSKIYRSDLVTSKQRMIEAQRKAKADLTLSRNTYKTVMLSSELYKLISESQNTFAEVSKIQIPNIVPFQNEQMKEKYAELTGLIEKE